MKRVLVIRGQHLLAAGILKVLSNEEDLHIFDASSSDEETVLEEIKKVDPAVLVLVDSSKFTDRDSLSTLFANRSDLRVVIIEERDNRMLIFERQVLEVKCTQDLVAAIRSD